MAIALTISGEATKLHTFLSVIIGQSFMMVPLFVFLINNNEPLFNSLRINPVSKEIVFYSISISIGLTLISDEIDRIIQIFIPAPEYIINLNDILKPETIIGGFLLFIAVAVLAPLGEEIIFRGFLQQILEKHWKDTTRAVLFTALIFSIIHMNPYWFIQIYILGVVLGFLAWKTQSIIAPLILHGLNNTVALLLSFLDLKDNNIYIWNEHVAPWVLVIALISIVVGFKHINQLKMH